MLNEPIPIGKADELLAEARQKAQREQIPLMHALKAVISLKIKAAILKSGPTKDDVNPSKQD